MGDQGGMSAIATAEVMWVEPVRYEGDHVDELDELFDRKAVLIEVRAGKKVPVGQWGDKTLKDMKDPEHRRRLGRGSIGVALGSRSNGLFTVDCDDDGAMQAFLEANPSLKGTLTSRGARGCNFWFWAASSVPPTRKLTCDGKPWGELRSEGSQTVIWGRHPSGKDYEFLVKAKPMTVDPNDIVWPAGVKTGSGSRAGTRKERRRVNVTEGTEGIEGIEGSEGTKEIITPFFCVPFSDDLLLKHIPTSVHENHARLFELAREVRSFEGRENRYEARELRAVFDRWATKAAPYLRTGMSADDYFMEFMEAYGDVRVLQDEAVFSKAFEKAKGSPPIRELEGLISDSQKLLLAKLCRELQRSSESAPFFLAARKVGETFGVSDKTGNRWLGALEALKVITTVVKGNIKTRKATRFRYLLPL